MDLALNNPQRLICHKTQATKQTILPTSSQSNTMLNQMEFCFNINLARKDDILKTPGTIFDNLIL